MRRRSSARRSLWQECRRTKLPRVGNKHFGYDKQGVKAAKEEAAKTGKDVKMTKGTKKGK